LEYEPLFPPGFHTVTLENLQGTFVDRFDNPSQRKELLNRFMAFLSLLRFFNVSFELWIDGSFATKKPDPADIDIAIICDSSAISLDKAQAFIDLFRRSDQVKIRLNCDIYYIHKDDVHTLAYWRGWFGFDRESNPKGIPRLFV